MSEGDLVARILSFLEGLGIIAWRQNSGVAKRRGYRIRLAPKGTPDIIGAMRSGRMFALETKDVGAKETGKKKLATKEAQDRWRRTAEASGVLHAKVYTWEQFREVWDDWSAKEAA